MPHNYDLLNRVIFLGNGEKVLWPICVSACVSFDLLHIQPPPALLAVCLDNSACAFSCDLHIVVWHMERGFDDTESGCVIDTVAL